MNMILYYHLLLAISMRALEVGHNTKDELMRRELEVLIIPMKCDTRST